VKVYLVGGAVRDELLGLPVKERDYVVVGATPEEMVAKGFKPVGKDFPVFLHPSTHEEYALARTERKSGRGYKGFQVYASPEVTLEEDLKRRDLTINAIAKAEDGTLIDPFGGTKDLENHLLRHVSEAFAEDPVRILRVARFAARFGFQVHEQTMALMRRMVDSGEADFLVPERVWQEFARGLVEAHPELMFDVLERSGLSRKLLPELQSIPAALSKASSLPVRFAVLTWGLADVTALCDRLRASNEVRELAVTANRVRDKLQTPTPDGLLEILKRADAFRRPERFADLLEAARLAEPGVDTARIERALKAAAAVDAGAIAAKASTPAQIPQLIDEARLKAIGRAP
jgi:tRNA nucleotidyltransferase (CCA-adding enzyme)